MLEDLSEVMESLCFPWHSSERMRLFRDLEAYACSAVSHPFIYV